MVAINTYTANKDVPTFTIEKGVAKGTGKGFKSGEHLKGTPVRMKIKDVERDLVEITTGGYVQTADVTMVVKPKSNGIILRALPLVGMYAGILLATKKGWLKPHQIFLTMLAGGTIASIPNIIAQKK